MAVVRCTRILARNGQETRNLVFACLKITFQMCRLIWVIVQDVRYLYFNC